MISKKLRFKCCSSIENHSSECYDKWRELKDYLCTRYIKDFDIIDENSQEADRFYPAEDFDQDNLYAMQ